MKETLLLRRDKKMENKIVKDFYNGLFSRREVQVSVEANITPSKDESVKIIAKQFSAEEGLVRIRDIKGKFGSRVFMITADIYDSKEEFSRVVKKTKQEIEKEKKAAEEKIRAEEEKLKAEEEVKAQLEEKSEETTEESQ